MKKLLFTLLTILALAAPVFAADGDPNVAISIVDEGSNVYRVDYEVLVEDGVDPGLMRAIALDISTSNTATIDSISDYDAQGASVPADSTQIPSGYPVYMGSIQFNPDPNYISSFGDPVAPNTDPDTLGGLGTTGITVEMGSLYEDGGTEPSASGILFRLGINLNGESDTILSVAANSTRGGCKMEDGSSANIVLVGTTPPPTDCMATTNPQYNDWIDWDNDGPDPDDKPDCWCYKKQCHGDTDGAMFGPFPVAANDFTTLKGALSKPAAQIPAGGICADLNHDAFGPFRVAADDFAELKRWLSQPDAMVPVCSGPGCVGFQGDAASPEPCDSDPLPNTEYNFWEN